MTDMVGLAAGIASVISILGAIYGFINHKRIRIRLCGRKLSASIHIDDKTAEKVMSEPVVVQTRRASTHERRERKNSVEGQKSLNDTST